MFAVRVKKEARKSVCCPRLVWVKDNTFEFYVNAKERGTWKTRAEAQKMITEEWEEIVEVPDVMEGKVRTLRSG